MREIPLTKGKVAKVDDSAFEELSQYRWQALQTKNICYAVRWPLGDRKNRRAVLMHRQILGLTNPKIEGDHVDGDGLNNQSSNLRVATHCQNIRNQRRRSDNTSGFKGVSLQKQTNRWRAQITVNGKTIHLGYFDDPETAAHERDRAAAEHHKQFARMTTKV